MKSNLTSIIILVCLFSFLNACDKDSAQTDFDKILGTYSGASTFSYTGLPNGTLVQENNAGAATITVSAVSNRDKTFRISGSGLASDAFEGYGNGVYTWDSDNLNGGTYFAVNTEGDNGSTKRDISTRFNIANGTVESDYEQRVAIDASVEQIHFEGGK